MNNFESGSISPESPEKMAIQSIEKTYKNIMLTEGISEHQDYASLLRIIRRTIDNLSSKNEIAPTANISGDIRLIYEKIDSVRFKPKEFPLLLARGFLFGKL